MLRNDTLYIGLYGSAPRALIQNNSNQVIKWLHFCKIIQRSNFYSGSRKSETKNGKILPDLKENVEWAISSISIFPWKFIFKVVDSCWISSTEWYYTFRSFFVYEKEQESWKKIYHNRAKKFHLPEEVWP